MAVSASASARVRMVGPIPLRALLATAVVVALLVAWEGYAWATAPSRITPELHAALARGDQPTYDIAVRLPFAPRQFHIRQFQAYGTFAGVEGTTVLIRRVEPAAIYDIARKYWVERVDLARLD